MKLSLISILFFYSINIFCQDFKTAIYGVTLIPNKESQLEKLMIDVLGGDYNSVSNELEFELNFNRNKSYFYLNEKLFTSPDLIELALLKAEYMGRIKQDVNNFYLEMDNDNYYRAIIHKKYPEWQITGETKMIDDYLCYRAVANHVVENSAGKFTFPIEAWFSPEINYSYGPNGYGGLPGLILELHYKDMVYGLISINFKPISIQGISLKNFPIHSPEEYNLKMTQNLPFKINY